jgi:hypothetical protein
MKRLIRTSLFMAVAGYVGLLAVRTLSPTRRAFNEVLKRTHTAHYVEHSHEAVVHTHLHPHVTHNRREGMDEVAGEWEHLTSLHEHEHNHAAVSHSHVPHENAGHEHLGEAHIHDHGHPSVS